MRSYWSNFALDYSESSKFYKIVNIMITKCICICLEYPKLHARILCIVGISVAYETRDVGNVSMSEP